jgi:hypothetical protein
MYDSKASRIVQKQVKKMPLMEGDPISIVTQVTFTGDVRKDHVATCRADYAFMDANIDNIQRLCKQNEEKELRIRELEEKLQQVRLMREASKASISMPRRLEMTWKIPLYICTLIYTFSNMCMQ